jgi:hypothetical protein
LVRLAGIDFSCPGASHNLEARVFARVLEKIGSVPAILPAGLMKHVFPPNTMNVPPGLLSISPKNLKEGESSGCGMQPNKHPLVAEKILLAAR